MAGERCPGSWGEGYGDPFGFTQGGWGRGGQSARSYTCTEGKEGAWGRKRKQRGHRSRRWCDGERRGRGSWNIQVPLNTTTPPPFPAALPVLPVHPAGSVHVTVPVPARQGHGRRIWTGARQPRSARSAPRDQGRGFISTFPSSEKTEGRGFDCFLFLFFSFLFFRSPTSRAQFAQESPRDTREERPRGSGRRTAASGSSGRGRGTGRRRGQRAETFAPSSVPAQPSRCGIRHGAALRTAFLFHLPRFSRASASSRLGIRRKITAKRSEGYPRPPPEPPRPREPFFGPAPSRGPHSP